MSFTIITNVFCDRCHNWDSKTGGAVEGYPDRKLAWQMARSVGWKKIKDQHICALCRLGDLAEEIAGLDKPNASEKDKKKVDRLSREYKEVVEMVD